MLSTEPDLARTSAALRRMVDNAERVIAGSREAIEAGKTTVAGVHMWRRRV
jgi:hypothetical protein